MHFYTQLWCLRGSRVIALCSSRVVGVTELFIQQGVRQIMQKLTQWLSTGRGRAPASIFNMKSIALTDVLYLWLSPLFAGMQYLGRKSLKASRKWRSRSRRPHIYSHLVHLVVSRSKSSIFTAKILSFLYAFSRRSETCIIHCKNVWLLMILASWGPIFNAIPDKYDGLST